MSSTTYQITKWVNITDDGNPVTIEPKFSTEEMPYKFTAKDDDGIVYCYGIAVTVDSIDNEVFSHLQNGYGITLIQIYCRLSGKYVNAIG